MIEELNESFAVLMKKILSLKSVNPPPKQVEKHQTRTTTTHFEADKS